MDIKTERFIVELGQRTKLLERMKANAERRVELNNIDTPLAKIDLEVAERALVRIAKKKDEVLGVLPAEKPDVEHPLPADVAEKDKEPVVEVPKKRVHKRPDALFKLAAEDGEEERLHSHPKGTFGGNKDDDD